MTQFKLMEVDSEKGTLRWIDLSKITRVELIQHGHPDERNNGRMYVGYEVESIELSVQDDGKTVKVFVNK